MQCDMSNGKDVDGRELTRIAGTYRRTCEALGLRSRNSDKASAAGLGALLADDLDKQHEARK
jgi:hypothetical protein